VAPDYSTTREGFRGVFGDVVCTGPVLCAMEWCTELFYQSAYFGAVWGLECTRPILCEPEWQTWAWVVTIVSTVGIEPLGLSIVESGAHVFLCRIFFSKTFCAESFRWLAQRLALYILVYLAI